MVPGAILLQTPLDLVGVVKSSRADHKVRRRRTARGVEGPSRTSASCDLRTFEQNSEPEQTSIERPTLLFGCLCSAATLYPTLLYGIEGPLVQAELELPWQALVDGVAQQDPAWWGGSRSGARGTSTRGARLARRSTHSGAHHAVWQHAARSVTQGTSPRATRRAAHVTQHLRCDFYATQRPS